MSTLTYRRRQVQYSGDSEVVGYDRLTTVRLLWSMAGYDNEVVVRQQDKVINCVSVPA